MPWNEGAMTRKQILMPWNESALPWNGSLLPWRQVLMPWKQRAKAWNDGLKAWRDTPVSEGAAVRAGVGWAEACRYPPSMRAGFTNGGFRYRSNHRTHYSLQSPLMESSSTSPASTESGALCEPSDPDSTKTYSDTDYERIRGRQKYEDELLNTRLRLILTINGLFAVAQAIGGVDTAATGGVDAAARIAFIVGIIVLDAGWLYWSWQLDLLEPIPKPGFSSIELVAIFETLGENANQHKVIQWLSGVLG